MISRHIGLCPGCFGRKGSVMICPICGHDEGEIRSPLALPLWTVLKGGDYLVGRVLGPPGSIGISYVGWDVNLEAKVVIREYLPKGHALRESGWAAVVPNSREDQSIIEMGLQQFLRGAQSLNRFNHEHIVRVRTIFRENATAYVVMDHHDGVTLEEYVKLKGGQLPEQQAMELMLPILDALHTVHEKGFLHGDIRPHHVFVTSSNDPILMGFGTTYFVLGEGNPGNLAALTPGFAPFEKYQGEGELGVWSDIYSMGATFYALVTGRTPPESPRRVRKDDLLPPERFQPALTPAFNSAVLRALNMEPRNRPQSMRELQALLMQGTPTRETSQPLPVAPQVPPTEFASIRPPSAAIEPPKPQPPITASPVPQPVPPHPEPPAAKSASVPAPGQPWTDPITSMQFAWIPAGTFYMGSYDQEFLRNKDEGPVSTVRVKGFWMGRYPVTQYQWRVLVPINPSHFRGDNMPVEQVGWSEAQDFLKKLSQRSRMQFRLPSEAEWEYACRAGTKTPFHFGESVSSTQADFDGRFPYGGAPKGPFRESTTPVGSFPPNAWGLYDMHGNVWEWCQDWYHEGYQGGPADGAAWENPKGQYRVARGGSWKDMSNSCRSANRYKITRATWTTSVGFRAVAFPKAE